MTPERWRHIDALLQQVMSRPPANRPAFLNELCANDQSAREEIESLISYRDLANSFLETPPIETPDTLFEADESLIGETLGTYTISAKLGKGGMGKVYLAHDVKLDRKVAIKLLPPEIEVGDRSERLIREAKAAARLNHPNICAIHEVVESPDYSFIVMEYVEGETLASKIQCQPLGLNESIRIIAQVADALSEAHSQGIIHRDIKPLNIMITSRGKAKVLDFGLAKIIGLRDVAPGNVYPQSTSSQPGMIVGTVPYMSPEQALAAALDTRSDLFSLGTVLYECVTGTRPFTGKTTSDIREKVVHVTPPPPSQLNPELPAELDRVIARALAKDPNARYQTAAEFMEDILQISHVKPSPSSKLRKVLLLAATLALLVLLYLIGPKIWHMQPHIPTAEAQSLYHEGLDASGIGAYYAASKKFEQAIQEDDKFALAHARLAEVCAELGFLDRANAAWVKVSSLVVDRAGSSDRDRLTLDAIVKVLSRDNAGAVASYREILENATEADKAKAQFDLARAYERNNESLPAIQHYDAARPNPGALLRLGIIYRKQDPQKAGETFDTAQRIYEENGCQEGSIEVDIQRGVLYRDAGEPLRALSHLDRAYELANASGNKNQQVRTLLLMSRLLNDQQKLDDAKERADLARRIAQQGGAEELSTEAQIDIGDALRELGKYDGALAQLQEALSSARTNHETRNEGRALVLIATVYMDLHEADRAVEYINTALSLSEQPGLEERKWYLQYLLADALDLKGDSASAESSHRTLLEEAEERGWPLRIATSYQALGQVSAHRGLFPEALQRSRECYERYKSIGSTSGVIDGLTTTADMLWQLGRFEEADSLLNLASTELKLLGSDRAIKNARIERVRLRSDLSKAILPEAADIEKLISTLNPGNEASIDVEIKSALGVALCRHGRFAKGIYLCSEAVELATEKQLAAWLSSPAKLSLAEALLLARHPGAVAKADEAIGGLPGDNHEFQWRALVIGARANRLLGNNSTARTYAFRAQESLSSLRAQWGDLDDSSYMKRKDIKTLKEHLSALLRSY